MTFPDKLGTIPGTLKAQLILILAVSALCGLLVGATWYHSRLMWKEHLADAFAAGVALAEQITALDPDTLDESFSRTTRHFSMTAVRPETITTADNSLSLKFPGASPSAFETGLSLQLGPGRAAFEGDRIAVRILSSARRYELGTIENTGSPGLASRMGMLVKALARTCGDPVLFIQAPDPYWLRVEGQKVWGCNAAPPDWRLPALLFSAVTLMIVFHFAINRTEIVEALARQINKAARTGQYQPLVPRGPREIRKVIRAINRLFTHERKRLEQRARLLSTISHDLGTPATRLKLRTALIADETLRRKLDKDIDHMTGMIEGVLTYARGEISSEPRRSVSMVALVQSLVDDYADTGQPVSLEPVAEIPLKRARSIFSTGGKRNDMQISAHERMLCQCQPNQIRRALSNLIDNALKYGKSATLHLEANAGELTICVCDEGSAAGPVDLEALVGAFKRGENATLHDGVGLGLSIVSSIVRAHGGRLEFQSLENGSRVCLSLPRS